MRIYMDKCCFSRPFDEHTQDRVLLEAEAVLLILRGIRTGRFTLIGSSFPSEENDHDPDAERRRQVRSMMALCSETVQLGSMDEKRAEELQRLGFAVADSIHVIAAEKGLCDVLLTTDDRLIAKAERHRRALRVHLANPVEWLREVTS